MHVDDFRGIQGQVPIAHLAQEFGRIPVRVVIDLNREVCPVFDDLQGQLDASEVLLATLRLKPELLLPLMPHLSEGRGDDADRESQHEDPDQHAARANQLAKDSHRYDITVSHGREGDENPPERVWYTQERRNRRLSIMTCTDVIPVRPNCLVPLATLDEVDGRGGETHGQGQVHCEYPEHSHGLVQDSSNDLEYLEGSPQLHKSEKAGKPQHAQDREIGSCDVQRGLHDEGNNHKQVDQIHRLDDKVHQPDETMCTKVGLIISDGL
mmetsp:Transcript_72174/g.168938  ORF Transcript_72174/g.168938 Transcript_72174/m.168938 type:complete len:267 (-) Transcript_72174:709-1509(-)